VLVTHLYTSIQQFIYTLVNFFLFDRNTMTSSTVSGEGKKKMLILFEQRKQLVEREIGKICGHFQAIIHSCAINSEESNFDSLQMTTNVNQLIFSSEILLRLVNELKQNNFLYDFERKISEVDEEKVLLQKRIQECQPSQKL